MVSLEKRIREQDVDVKTVCFGERTARKLHNEGRDRKLLGEVEKQRVIATELVLKELRGVVQQIRVRINELQLARKKLETSTGRSTLDMQAMISFEREERQLNWVLGLLVDEEEK